MANESARLLQKLLDDDVELGNFISKVERGELEDPQIREWIDNNRARILRGLLTLWPDLPQLRAALPARPTEDGWSPRVDLGFANLSVDSPAATVQRAGGKRYVIALLPPDTAALTLSAGPVQGSGRLQVRDGQASGTLGLRLGAIDVNGLALLKTQDDVASIIVVLGIRFVPPVQLSFGFALTAVGGVIGVHRRIDGDALRARLADGSALDALFPANPADGANQMLAALAAIFQTEVGRHVVGPTFTLTWLDLGVTTLVRMDIGVLVQYPDGRVAVVGRAALDLGPILALRLDVFGEIDPGRKLIAIDAVLVGSRVMGIFRVTGTGAFRSSAASPPYVVAALGGFYPGYHPEPAEVPPQQRLGLALDVPCPLTIRASGYLGITSNTFQAGAELEVSIDLSVIYARGFLRFDAIVEFEPFHLHADFAAGWQVRVVIFEGGTTVSGWIDGPGPWIVHARVSISLLIDDFSWSDTFRFGPTGPPPEPPVQRLADVLAATFGEPSNLKAYQANDPHVAIRPQRAGLEPGRALCSPLGALSWSQHVVPLDLWVTRAGGRRLAFPQQVSLVIQGSVAQPDGEAHEWFAPGTFMTLTQAEALALPPFQFLKAGRQLRLAMDYGGETPPATLDHDTFVRAGGTMARLAGPSPRVTISPRLSDMAVAATAAPMVSNRTPLVSITQERWVHFQKGTTQPAASPVHAVSAVAQLGGAALAEADRPIPVERV